MKKSSIFCEVTAGVASASYVSSSMSSFSVSMSAAVMPAGVPHLPTQVGLPRAHLRGQSPHGRQPPAVQLPSSVLSCARLESPEGRPSASL